MQRKRKKKRKQRKNRRQPDNCRLCGTYQVLSFEHVPPESAYNKQAVIYIDGRSAIEPGGWRSTRGRTQQRGVGAYTLCEQCNSNTGGWYGDALACLCHQAVGVLRRASGQTPTITPYYLFPLRVIKQIVTMFFSINSHAMRSQYPELVDFVLNRNRIGMPRPFRIFIYYTRAAQMRLVGWASKWTTGRTCVLTEITFPPFGYVMTYGSGPPHHEQYEITTFGDVDYDCFKVCWMKTSLLPTVSALPGDYMTSAQLDQCQDTIEEVRDKNGQPTNAVFIKRK